MTLMMVVYKGVAMVFPIALVTDQIRMVRPNDQPFVAFINNVGIRICETLYIKQGHVPASHEDNFQGVGTGSSTHGDFSQVVAPRAGLAKVDWLVDKFDLDMSLLARLGGHSAPRTHRGKERFPGMTITYALIQMVEKILGLGVLSCYFVHYFSQEPADVIACLPLHTYLIYFYPCNHDATHAQTLLIYIIHTNTCIHT